MNVTTRLKTYGEPEALAPGVSGEPEALAPGALRALTLRALTLPARLLVPIVWLGVLLIHCQAQNIASLDDIEFWAGSGANRSALAIDWQGDIAIDNSLVWGFRWEGTATGLDMLTAIVSADPRLYAKTGSVGGFGTGVIGLGYDVNNDGLFSLDDDTPFDDQGFATSGPADGAVSVDPADWYAEGWFINGFWHYGIAPTSPFDGGAWARSGGGISNRSLANGSWDSLAFTPTYSNQAFAQNPLVAEVSGNADFDGDGDIDGRDFLAWQRGGSTDPLSAGDLADWQADYPVDSLSAFRLPRATLNLLVPEPASLGCFCLAAGAWSVLFRCFRFTTRRLNS